MAVQEQSKFLPEVLVEKIVAMIPFPSLFKARCLSKSWQAKFGPVSSLSDEKDKLCATSFHNEVAKWSNRWPTVSPVCATKKGLMGYDQVSRSWRRLPALLVLQPHDKLLLLDPDGRMEGALLCKILERKRDRTDIHVLNILTGENKVLPTLPHADYRDYVNCLKIVSDSSSGTYKLIVSRQQFRYSPQAYIHVYDSKSEAWSHNDFSEFITCQTHYVSCAYLNGVLYLNKSSNWRLSWPRILAFNVEDESMTELVLSCNTSYNEVSSSTGLVICNENLVMIVVDPDSCSVCVLRIDPESQRMWEVAQCAPESSGRA